MKSIRGVLSVALALLIALIACAFAGAILTFLAMVAVVTFCTVFSTPLPYVSVAVGMAVTTTAILFAMVAIRYFSYFMEQARNEPQSLSPDQEQEE